MNHKPWQWPGYSLIGESRWNQRGSMYRIADTSVTCYQGSLDTYRFCDEVWTFLIKNVTFKMENGSQTVTADKVKIVSCNAKRPGEGQ